MSELDEIMEEVPLKSGSTRDTVRWVISVGLTFVFAWAGLAKLASPAGFADDILQYRVVGFHVAAAAAYILPPLELLCAAGLLVRSWNRSAASILLGLMAVFTVALLSAWLRGLDISCGCFGSGDALVQYPLYLLRDVVLLAACGFVLLAEGETESGVTPRAAGHAAS